MKRVVMAYFSPTHTTQKVARAIAEGTGIGEVVEVDMTCGDCGGFEAAEGDVVVMAGPVYSSRIPSVASERLEKIKGSGQPAVCVAVYGNNKFGDALIELADIAEKSGLIAVAGAGFIGEHSYANNKWPIAIGRPNDDDIALARAFGKNVIGKIAGGDEWKLGLKALALPGEIPNKPAPKMPFMQSVATERCTGCGKCIEACPVGAIDEKLLCDGDKCIKCCACVKACPENARELTDPMIEKFSIKLSKMPDKDPEMFL